ALSSKASRATPPPLLHTQRLNQRATVMAASQDGQWLAVGNDQGDISTYQPIAGQLQQSASATIHQGAVTALVFEPHQQRFFSAGADQKLYSTHAQGELQALDKGKNSNHSGVINALWCAGDRLYSGADDQSVKAWLLTGGQPSTCKQGLVKVTHLAVLHSEDQPFVLAVGQDQSLRAIRMNTDGKLGDVEWVIHDGYDWANDGLADADPSRYQNALTLLAEYDDAAALKLIGAALKKQTDPTSRERLVAVFVQSQHPQSTLALEDLLKDKLHPSVRLMAFQALTERAAQRPDPLHHAVLALASGDVPMGQLALQQLAVHAATLPRAEQDIQQALQHPQADIRHLALHLLEQRHAKDDPKASLLALQSPFANTQRAALIRLYQRQLLQHLEVKRSVVLLQEHRDPLVRQTAFWVAVLSHPALAHSLQQRDADFARPLQDLTQFQLLHQSADLTSAHHALSTLWQKLTTTHATLDADALEPLLQGISNRFADVCFDAAYGLALLHDQRAFGVLLRLAQDPAVHIRMGVAKALAALQFSDSKTVLVRMLNDTDAGVRDAALTAYGRLETDPLQWAMVGLQAKYLDSHTRGLKILLDQLSPTITPPDVASGLQATVKNVVQRLTGSTHVPPLPVASQHVAAQAVLKHALNDPFEAIRLEAVKACLNRQWGGNRASTLHLLLASQHVDVHQAVLTEWMAEAKTPNPVAEQRIDLMIWFEQLLQDPFEPVRQAALSVARADKKRFALEQVLACALHSPFVDVRRAALNALLDKRSAATDALLPLLFADAEPQLRVDALNAALQVTAGGALNTALLTQALVSPYDDIRMAAAQACAAQGDGQAFAVFDDVLTRAKPQTATDIAAWQQQQQHAFKGLALLRDPRGFDWVMACVQQPARDDVILMAATAAMPWVCTPDHADRLSDWMSDERITVRAAAALGLALWGDARAWPALQDQRIQTQWSAAQQLMALNGLGAIDVPHLEPYLQRAETCHTAQLLLLSYEAVQHPHTPYHSIHALSLPAVDTVLLCAGIVARYADPSAWMTFLQQQLNTWSNQQEPRWSCSSMDIQRLCAVLVLGDAHSKAQAVMLLQHLDRDLTYAAWQLAERTFVQRHTVAIDTALAQTPHTPTVASTTDQHTWQSLAFGAYVGVLRQSDSSLNLRERALRQLVALGSQQPAQQDSIQRCIVPLLNHDQQAMRQLAYDSLLALGMSAGALGQLAITTVQADIAKQGLNLWMTQLNAAESERQLQQLIQTSSAILSMEAWRLLQARHGTLAVLPLALQSYYLPLRQHALNDLKPHLVTSAQAPVVAPVALALLKQAAQNDDRATALLAARLLAEHHLPDADAVIQGLLWRSVDEHEQTRLLTLLRHQPQPHMAQWLISYLDHPQRRVARRHIYHTVGQARQTDVVDLLLMRLVQHPDDRNAIIDALMCISGYDQAIVDRDDTLADTRWRDQQAPRHDAVLIALFERLLSIQAQAQAVALLDDLAWAHDPNIDQTLLQALPQLKAEHQLALVTCMARRADKRQGNLHGLQSSLSHKQPDVQFVAAEGLAKRGQAQGISLLLAVIEHHNNGAFRQRAVLALGELGDMRAYDALLKLAEDDGHYLQAVAAEALGHLGQGEQGARVLRILKQQLHDSPMYSDRVIHLINGLRWINHPEGWQRLRDFSLDAQQYTDYRAHALHVLQHHDSLATRDVLLTVLRQESDPALVAAAYHSAQHLWGNQSNQAYAYDLALLQGAQPLLDDQHALNRVNQSATAAQLLEVLQQPCHPHATDTVAETLQHSLLQRSDLDITQLQQGLGANDDGLLTLCARYLAAHRDSHWTPSMANIVQQALLQRMATWQTLVKHGKRQTQLAPARRDNTAAAQEQALQQAIQALWWLVARYADSSAALDQALAQLLQPQSTEAVSPQWINTTVQALLARPDLPQAWTNTVYAALPYSSGQTRDWFSHLVAQQPPLQPTHHQSPQPVNVLALIQAQNGVALAALAHDATQPDVIRLGAIEGLAHIDDPVVEQQLLALSQLPHEDPALCQAAFRALRRLQRLQQRRQQHLTRRAGASL
ncbi:MAG: hypothetical protein RLY58_2027, partial [Pseudomonadota bacterium]